MRKFVRIAFIALALIGAGVTLFPAVAADPGASAPKLEGPGTCPWPTGLCG